MVCQCPMRYVLRRLKRAFMERFRHAGILTRLHVARLRAQGVFTTLVRRSANLVYRSSRHTDFIVLCAPRTGSTYLSSLLGSHPNIRMHGELFSTSNLLVCPRVRRAPVQYLRHEVYSCYPPRIRAVGFNLLYYHARSGRTGVPPMDPKAFTDQERERLERIWEYLRRREELRVVHLRRRNPLRSLASGAVAMATEQWSRQAWEPERSPEVRVRLEPARALKRLEETAQAAAVCQCLFARHPCLDVYYEDLVNSRDSEIRRIHDFLGVPWAAPSSMLQRQNPRPLPEMLSNYDELKAALAGTRWEALLET